MRQPVIFFRPVIFSSELRRGGSPLPIGFLSGGFLLVGFLAGAFLTVLSGCLPNGSFSEKNRTEENSFKEAGLESSKPQDSRIDGQGSLDAAVPKEAILSLSIPKEAKRIQGHNGEVLLLARAHFPQDGVLSVGVDGQIIAWPNIGKEGYLIAKTAESLDVASICVPGSLIAVSNKEGTRVLKMPEMSFVARLSVVRSRTASLGFSPDCTSLLIGGSDGMVYRWRFVDQQRGDLDFHDREELLERYIAHSAAVASVAFHPFGRIFFSGDWDGGMNAWLRYDSDAFGGEYNKNVIPGDFFTTGMQRMRAARVAGDDMNEIHVSPDGLLVLTALQSGLMELWKVRGLKKLCEIQAHKGLLYDAQFTPDYQGAVSVGRDGHAKVWQITTKADLAGGPDIYTFVLVKDGSAPDLRFVQMLPNGILAGASLQGRVLPVDVEAVATPTPVPTFMMPSSLSLPTPSPTATPAPVALEGN